MTVLCLVTSSLAADWPTYLHNNSRNGGTAESLPRALAPAWVYSTPAAPELAFSGPRRDPIEGKVMRHRVAFDRALQPVAAGGRVFFGSSVDHNLYCRDAASGEMLWSFYTEGPIRLAPTVWQGKVYFGSDDGYVYCLQAKDGCRRVQGRGQAEVYEVYPVVLEQGLERRMDGDSGHVL
mgnify:CR=1 FL=1